MVSAGHLDAQQPTDSILGGVRIPSGFRFQGTDTFFRKLEIGQTRRPKVRRKLGLLRTCQRESFFFKFIYFERGGGGERERLRIPIGSTLSAQSPTWGSDS